MVHRKNYTDHLLEIQRVEEKNRQTSQGDKDKQSIAQLKLALSKLVVNRGRVWTDCEPRTVDQRTGAVGVRTLSPPNLAANNILYVFEAVPDEVADGIADRRYVGEFRVTQAGDPNPQDDAAPNISLQPTSKLDAAEIQRLQQSRGPWLLYEAMPLDSHEPFAGKSEDQIRALFPKPANEPPGVQGVPTLAEIVEATIQDYLKHGKPAQDDDPLDRKVVKLRFTKDAAEGGAAAAAVFQELRIPNEMVAKGELAELPKVTADRMFEVEVAEPLETLYHRPLRDYGLDLRDFGRRMPMMRDSIASAIKDVEFANNATDLAEKYYNEREQERMRLVAEKTRLDEEVQVVSTYQTDLEKELATYREAIQQATQQNLVLAARWRKLQLEAAQRIEASASATAASRPAP
jgi:hypothetical protein